MLKRVDKIDMLKEYKKLITILVKELIKRELIIKCTDLKN